MKIAQPINQQQHTVAVQRLARWVSLLLVISFLVSACSGRMGSRFTDNKPADASVTIKAPSNITPGIRMGSEEFGLSKQELVEYIEKVEGLIAQCMQEAGFEYLAVDYNTVRRGMTADKSLPGYSEGQFMREFGFGIASLYTGQAPQLAAVDTPAKIGLGEQNARIFANLSTTEQVAYSRTLFGENPDVTFAVTLEAENFSLTGGCTRKAIEQVFKPEELSATYINAHDVIRQQDPNMAGVFKEFANCIHAYGFNYSLEQEIEPDLKRRLNAITKGEPIETLSAEAQSALKRLQEEEVAIAVALLECGEP
ncbi:MAG: hypothetical protein ACOYNY_36285 [Caldilineaceae bacterium]